MKVSQFSMSITDIPEVLQTMRAEMARVLRDVADDEEPRVARRLREVAAAFEAGVTDLG